jgi:hypothetical protein
MHNWLKFGRRVLLACLLKHDAARVTAANEIELYKEAITRKYPRMRNVWGACDGLKLQIEESGNWFIQNQFYNGWTHGHYVNCIFVFAADGRIRICVINTPGTWHDSRQADHGEVPLIVIFFERVAEVRESPQFYKILRTEVTSS